MIYLASPYSHPDLLVREARFAAACLATAELVRAGRPVFSPIVQSHPLAQLGLPTDWSFWKRIDEACLRRCDAVFVLTIDGWQQSVGVRAEIEIATAQGKPVHYLEAI
jgi:nucleoside 2-deoxyribosyltransferase